jgi:hypothetical protein
MSELSKPGLTSQSVQEELQRQPHILMRLAENALTVAESLRNNYFQNTAEFVTALRQSIYVIPKKNESYEPVLTPVSVSDAHWSDYQSEVVTFIDGGIGSVQISSQIPILLRVGSYRVKTGETRLREREQFGYYPVILGDLEGGSKERKDFPDIVRITAELLGGLAALQRTPDLRVLMFHGPLVYMVGGYSGHTPFSEKDIDLFLHHYAGDVDFARDLKEKFLEEARVEMYPHMTDCHSEWVRRRVFEPLSWMAYLCRRLIQEAKKRTPIPLIAGVVERGDLRQFTENVLLERVFKRLRKRGKDNYFNEMFGRADLNSPKALLDRLGYTDTLLLAMILQCGEISDPWIVDKYEGLRHAAVALPGESATTNVGFETLKPEHGGFPSVQAMYLHVSETTEPIRIELFQDLGADQILEMARRTYLYSRLLPGYGFPVGLDIVDKYAKVPSWLTNAYSKLIRFQLGVSLQKGEISDADMRKILVQAIYMTHRDWLFRPQAR